MEPKKKKIYIGLIIGCLVLSAGILLWSQGLFGSEEILQPEILNTGTVISQIPNNGNKQTSYNPPPVFPATEIFKSEVLESEEYTSLDPYTLLDITGQLGRPDPFNSY